MITLEELRTAAPEDCAVNLAYTVMALIGTARLALENETSGEDAVGGVTTVLELAEQLSRGMIGGCEGLERLARRGMWGPEPQHTT